ncbi:hypothetical protein EYF80_059333 [Liparis tanakae]|uniref:Uncharacterized protein n=1 Tax=Liparis tanakae TaxID=230148 RepID=A0A4Z2EP25_9TELE|nr:hypothetical protein EYF80_059333 [Liparis tanakae]
MVHRLAAGGLGSPVIPI